MLNLDEIKAAFLGGMSQAEQLLMREFHELRMTVKAVERAVDNLDTTEERYVLRKTVDIGATGTGTAHIEHARAGMIWSIKRISMVTQGGANVAGVLYVGDVNNPANQRWATDEAAFVSEDQGDGIWVNYQDKLAFTVSGAPPNSQVYVGLQIERIQG